MSSLSSNSSSTSYGEGSTTSSRSSTPDLSTVSGVTESTLLTRAPHGTELVVKHIDKARDPNTGQWKLFDSASSGLNKQRSLYSKYKKYALILQRKVIQRRNSDIPKISTKVLIHNRNLIKVIRGVMKDLPKISWNTMPFKIDPQLLLAFLPRFRDYLADEGSKKNPSSDDDQTRECLSFVIEFLETEYSTILRKIDNLVSHGEITFDLLWAIFIPRTVIFTSCKTTSEPRALRLMELHQEKDWLSKEPYWRLVCEYVDENEGFTSMGHQFGLGSLGLKMTKFDGVVKIVDLKAYPMQFHPNSDNIRAKLTERGRKWVGLSGMHHVRYDGVAYRQRGNDADTYTKVTVNSRIMIDRHTFAAADPNYGRQTATKSFSGRKLDWAGLGVPKTVEITLAPEQAQDLGDDDLLLTTPILYGFSLTDKRWLEFNVEHVQTITWNEGIFRNLAIDHDQKVLLQNLVESHMQNQSIDDFVEGKGLGLVFNLFGPPGVGKSLTVETISELLHRPLYIVGASDLGTNASTLHSQLTDIFYAASKWKAVVLIDEADVFLEERGTANLERNALVAEFLRQIEYYRGILFLTTNRVKTFDPAFQSRIHLSIHYKDLSPAAKEHIWRGFLDKARESSLGVEDLTVDQVKELSNKELNGRQIKNVAKIAVSLASHEHRSLNFADLTRTLDMMGAYRS